MGTEDQAESSTHLSTCGNILHGLRCATSAGLVVDDHEEIVHEFGGVVVRPYFFADDDDKELLNVTNALLDYANSGSSSFVRFVSPRNGAN